MLEQNSVRLGKDSRKTFVSKEKPVITVRLHLHCSACEGMNEWNEQQQMPP